MTVQPLAALAVGLFGLIIGSFLNVCIYRIPRNLSIVSPRSRCTACGHELSWYENLPVVSYAWLRAKCRSCGAPFSMMYPLVELTTAAVFVVGYWRYGASPMLAARLLFACAMIVLFVIDLQHKIVPNRIVAPAAIYGLVTAVAFRTHILPELLIAGAAAFTFFLVAALINPRGMGMGDVKLAGVMGLYLGKLVIPALAFALPACKKKENAPTRPKLPARLPW